MDEHMKFIRSMFEMETGNKVRIISQISFSEYIVETENGGQFIYRC